jgi:hypothetical protein
MRFAALVAAVLLPLVAAPTATAVATESIAPGVVRGYFAALERKDFGRALSLTAGSAQERTEHMVGRLNSEAAQHHAQVELRVRSLSVAEQPAAADAESVSVLVNFDIDVIGKKWIFRRVARRLSGTAQFFVEKETAQPRIVAILGRLE